MKILVTGANGYLGSGVVNCLCSRDVEVLATDYISNQINNKAKIIECDLFSLDDPYGYFNQPDVLLHMAWKNGFIHNDESHIVDLPKHYKFIKKMAESGCKHIAVMGTMHEIGFYEGCIDENTPTHPENLYGISKDALRNLVELLCKTNDITYQWLRAYYIVGKSEVGASIFSKISLAEKQKQKHFPFTSGQNQYDFIDYDVFCEQVVAAVMQSDTNGIINICNGRPEKLSDRVERFIRENNYEIKLEYGKYPDRPYDSKAVWGNDKKIKEILLR